MVYVCSSLVAHRTWKYSSLTWLGTIWSYMCVCGVSRQQMHADTIAARVYSLYTWPAVDRLRSTAYLEETHQLAPKRLYITQSLSDSSMRSARIVCCAAHKCIIAKRISHQRSLSAALWPGRYVAHIYNSFWWFSQCAQHNRASTVHRGMSMATRVPTNSLYESVPRWKQWGECVKRLDLGARNKQQ